ncbi:MAG: DegT/DnrJ/EryC1/StrS family aminotransferase [Candidatus Aenigmarchaeota archaeon]|nr:DegT/DnrJ/EryC1/StrS family aminotransferase [Candidatus Aenigmarchaeota archaeon]
MATSHDAVSPALRDLIAHSFHPPATAGIPLSVPSYGPEEIAEALDSLLTTQVTMGAKVRQFESLFSSYVGAKEGVMVNSGSSADLVALSALANPALPRRLRPGDEVLTPAVTWSTTVFSILAAGAVPHFVDVTDDYLMDIEQLKEQITPKTRAIMPVHLLGNPCDMKAIMDLASDHDLFVVEDCCEAHGAEVRGKRVGSFGHLSAFSFFFSHHISTIEGGMTLTSDPELADLARILRAHGWIRESFRRDELAARHKGDPRFTFVNFGYNLRPMEIQGAMGIHQVGKLERFIEQRRETAAFWTRRLGQFSDLFLLPKERPGTRHVWFGYPLTIRETAPFTRDDLTRFLAGKQIETRPIMTGNMAAQPAMRLLDHEKPALPVAEQVNDRAFFVGNHHGVGDREREYLVSCIEEFVADSARG